MLNDPLLILSCAFTGLGWSGSSASQYEARLLDLSPGRTARAIDPSSLSGFNPSAPAGVSMKAGNVTIAHSVSAENKGQSTSRTAIRVDATKVVVLTGQLSTAQATLTMSLPDIAWTASDVQKIVEALVGLVMGTTDSGGTYGSDGGTILQRLLAGEP